MQFEAKGLGATIIGGTSFVWSQRTYVMGVINVTPDSFSGDGLIENVDAAVQQAAQMHVHLVNLVEQGFEPPLHIVTLSATGAMTLGRWVRDGEAMAYTPVSDHFPPGVAIDGDMHILVVDARGEAATIYREKVKA